MVTTIDDLTAARALLARARAETGVDAWIEVGAMVEVPAAALTAAPGIVNQWNLPARSDEIYGRLTGGANFTVTDAINLQVRASMSLGQDDGNDASGFAALRVAF